MDRPIRPLWPDGYCDEVQIQSMVVASDRENDGDVLAMNGAAAALLVSPLPFLGPLASVRLARIDGQLVPFPSFEDLESSDLDLIVSGTRDAVTMIEGFAQEFPEDEMVAAILHAHAVIREIIELQQEFAQRKHETSRTSPANDGTIV